MKTLTNHEICLVSGGIDNAQAQRDPSYNFAVLVGYGLGATIGAATLSSMIVPLSIATGSGYGLIALTAMVGGLGGGNLMSTASSILWKKDNP